MRRSDGEVYEISSLGSFRFGLRRYLRSVGSSFDICKDAAFDYANKAWFEQRLERRQLDTTPKDEPAISLEDLQKLYQDETVFDTATSHGLQRKVWFEAVVYLCRKNSQRTMRKLLKSDFEIGEDCRGRYVCRVGLGQRMYSTHGTLCPVSSFVKYLSLLDPHCPKFLQRPIVSKCYRGRAGGDYLSSLMKKVSRRFTLIITSE